MRKRSPGDRRMHAAVRRRRTHVSRQWVAGRISCGITSWHGEQNGQANRPAHTRPPKGRIERHRPRGPRAAVSFPPGGVPPAPVLCARPGPFPRTRGACLANGDPGRPGALSPQRSRNQGPTRPTTLPAAPVHELALGPTEPRPGQTLEATASPARPMAARSASCGAHPPKEGN